MRITAYGHENITATHPTTIEITTESHLTKRGDCIIGVRASHSLSDLRENLLSLRGFCVTVTFSVNNSKETVHGFIHPALTFTDTRVIILRKSSFLCPRTLAVQSNKAAKDLDRALIDTMKTPEQKMVIHIQSTRWSAAITCKRTSRAKSLNFPQYDNSSRSSIVFEK